MYRLKQQYGDQIEFIVLNVDNDDTLPLRQKYDMVARAQYALVDANGELVQKWFGYLDEAEVAEALDTHLAES